MVGGRLWEPSLVVGLLRLVEGGLLWREPSCGSSLLTAIRDVMIRDQEIAPTPLASAIRDKEIAPTTHEISHNT